MPPLQVFSDVLRLDRPKKSIDEDSFADIEMWKEVTSKREQFDISEADIFHFFSQKAQLPASVLVGGHNSGCTNPFQARIHYLTLIIPVYLYLPSPASMIETSAL